MIPLRRGNVDSDPLATFGLSASNNFNKNNGLGVLSNPGLDISNQFDLGSIGIQGTPNSGQQGGFQNFLNSFKNNDGSLNFGNIGAGVGILGDMMGAYMAMKQFGLAKDSFNHGVALDKANLENSSKLAQSRLDLQAQQRAHERPDLYGGQEVTQLRQTLSDKP